MQAKRNEYTVVSGHHGESLPWRIFGGDDVLVALFRYRSDAEDFCDTLNARKQDGGES